MCESRQVLRDVLLWGCLALATPLTRLKCRDLDETTRGLLASSRSAEVSSFWSTTPAVAANDGKACDDVSRSLNPSHAERFSLRETEAPGNVGCVLQFAHPKETGAAT